MTDMKILIVGAGPTGLTAAVELTRLGYKVDIIDKRDAASSFSRAVGILPISLQLLTPSGASKRLIDEGMKFRKAKFYDSDREMLNLPFVPREIKHGNDFVLGLAQDRTETILSECLTAFGGDVTYEKELVGLTDHGERVEAAFADGSSGTYRYVIGADGVRSTVRELTGIDFPGFELPETWSIADVDAKNWAHTDAFIASMMPGGKVVVVAPLEETRFRVIANAPNALDQLLLAMDVTNIRRESEFKISIRQVETYQKGNVFLAGDAAHCHSPVGGRGMNLGIADAVDLATRIVGGDVSGYGPTRHAEGAKVVGASERARKFITSSSLLERTILKTAFRLIHRVPAMQRRMAETVLYG